MSIMNIPEGTRPVKPFYKYPKGTSISEADIYDFCKPCEKLGKDNLCTSLVHPFEEQAENAIRLYCEMAKVKGVRGTLDEARFYERDWLRHVYVVKEYEETVTPEARDFARNLTKQAWKEMQQIVESEFQQYWEGELNRDPTRYKGLTPEEINDRIYDYYFANFLAIVPGTELHARRYEYYQKHWDEYPSKEYRHTELYCSQTHRQFTGIVYAAVEAEGLSIEEIFRLSEGRDQFYEQANLFTYLLPLYIRLRALGYNYYQDLM